jgi:hypothetical protein
VSYWSPNKELGIKNAPIFSTIKIPDEIKIEYVTCKECLGYGRMNFSTHYTTIESCNNCNGSGYIISKKTKNALKSIKQILNLLKTI